MGRKITWHGEVFFPLLETQVSVVAGPRSTLCSAPADGRCNHLHGGNGHKCCFLQVTARKPRSPSVPAGRRSETRSAPTSQGLFACVFGCCLPFRTRWVGTSRVL